MSVRTVFLPPVAPKKGESFDQYQFSKRPKMVTATSGISRDDLSYNGAGQSSGMHFISKHVSTLPVPPWTASDEKIKLIVAHMLWRMVHMSGTTFPQERYDQDQLALVLELEGQLKKRCIDIFQIRHQTQQLSIVGQKRSKKFGYAKILSMVIYQRYRMGKKSNVISAEFKGLLTPCGIRQLLSRANTVARVILPAEDNLPFRNGASARMKRDIEYKRARFLRGDKTKNRGKKWLPPPEEIFKLIQSGRTSEDLSREYDCNLSAVETKFRAGRAIVLEGRKPRARQGLSIPQILQLHREGLSVEEITVESKRSLAFVSCVLNENGLLKSPPVPNACDIDPSHQS